MTREEAKELLPIIQAFAEGKTIEFLNEDVWIELDAPDFTWSANNYRIKPESKYRPFKNKEECWNEMLKHEPFGWIMNSVKYHLITSVDNINILLDGKIYYTFEEAFNNHKFADGTPFGIKED